MIRPSTRLRALLSALLLSASVLACGDPADDARAQRLERLVTRTETAQARSDLFGRDLDLLRFLRERLPTVGQRSWVGTNDGGLHVLSLRAYHQWNSTAEGRTVPRGMDYDDPAHPIHAIVARAESLREAGVDYLYVIVPSRIEVYPELLLRDLEGASDFPGMSPATFAFQAELARRGVESVPLLEVFSANRFGPKGERWLYLKAGTLWTPAGVALAANEIATAVSQLPWFEQGPALEGVDFVVDVQALNQTAPIPQELAGLPSLETLEPLPIEAIRTRDGLNAHVPSRESPIVLLGDNAVGIYEQNVAGDLAGQLYRLLGHRLDIVSSSAGDHWLTFDRRPNPLEGKQLVIEVQSNGFRLPPTPHAPLPTQ